MSILLCDLFCYPLQILPNQGKIDLHDHYGEEGISYDYGHGDISCMFVDETNSGVHL
jgi:hypothetical protein